MSTTDLWQLSAVDLARVIRSRQASSREVVDGAAIIMIRVRNCSGSRAEEPSAVS